MRVGVFDSGVGGLTVLRAIRERYPRLDLLYLGDTARVPYGMRSASTVVRYSLECANFLLEKGIDLLVVACNTASAHALPALREALPVPVVGVIEPGVLQAVKSTKSGKVGVIGTPATVKSGAYQRLLQEKGLSVVAKACPLFVPLVEEGLLEGEITDRVVEHYLKDLKESAIDTLILGCTHYPLLKKSISRYMEGVEVIDSSQAVSESLKSLVKDEGEGRTELYFTDFSQNLDFTVSLLLGRTQEVRLAEGVFTA